MALKGIILGASIAVFITALIFTFTGFFGGIQKNIITGAVINPSQLATYSIVPLVLSFVIGLFLILFFVKKKK